MPEKSVKLKLLFHRGVNCVGIYFEKDFEVIAHVKKIPNVKFSLTHRCWYVPAGPDAISSIIETLRNKVWVDFSGIKKASEQKIKTAELPSVISNTESNSYEEARTIALEQIRKKLKLKNYSPSTAKTYLDQFSSFLRFFPDSNPEDLGEDEIQHYLLHLIENRKLSVSTQNQAINSIKFYFEKVLKQERKVYNLDRPMKEKRLPEILSQAEVMEIFEVTKNIKHRLMLMLIYASGLRRSELLNLRIGDVDLDRGIVLIRSGKGRKDRQSVMAQSLAPLVKEYFQAFNPKFWFFEGQKGEQYSATSLQQILKRAAAKARIKKRVRLHMLRHSFATHLLESGTSTRYIQILLGHESPKTTELYAQVTRFGIDKIQSPLDQIAQSRQLRGDDT